MTHMNGMSNTLWDIATSNQFGQFENEKEGLALVRTLLNHYGPQYAQELGLGRLTADGAILEPLSGEALIARVDEVLFDQGTSSEKAGMLTETRSQHRGAA